MQFCRMYTGDDGKSHFEELDQSEGSKFFQSALTVKALIFKNDQNRDDLHGWHNAPRRQWCITLSGTCEIGIGDGTKKTFGPGDVFLRRRRHRPRPHRAAKELGEGVYSSVVASG